MGTAPGSSSHHDLPDPKSLVEDALVVLTNLGIGKYDAPGIVLYTAVHAKTFMMIAGITDRSWINAVIAEASDWVTGSLRSGNDTEGNGNANR